MDDPDEKPVCDCCGYPAELEEYRGPIVGDSLVGEGKSMFCDICASTFLSHCITYPRLYGENRYLWRSVGWIANRLLDEIRRVKEAA